MAIVVDQKLELQQLLDGLERQSTGYRQDIRLFDVYTGKGIEAGKKSLAFRIVMQDTRRTLQEAEVDAAMQQVAELSAAGVCSAASRLTGMGMTLTKAELADLLFEKVGLNKREAKDMVEAFFEEIRNALERGDGVKLSGFGNFQLRDKPQRPGRNPKTGEEIPITARRVVTFPCQPETEGRGGELSYNGTPQS
jgi:integration host factor subunit alpha